jgi:dynein heavy chain, axonemal
MMDKSRRWPLCIDPQDQANSFIKSWGKDNDEGIESLKPVDTNLVRNLELSIQFGKWVLLEALGVELDPVLEPLLLKQTRKEAGQLVISLGDKNITYNENFKFFMTTTLPNPHYSPEVSVKVTIINFAITI